MCQCDINCRTSREGECNRQVRGQLKGDQTCPDQGCDHPSDQHSESFVYSRFKHCIHLVDLCLRTSIRNSSPKALNASTAPTECTFFISSPDQPPIGSLSVTHLKIHRNIHSEIEIEASMVMCTIYGLSPCQTSSRNFISTVLPFSADPSDGVSHSIVVPQAECAVQCSTTSLTKR